MKPLIILLALFLYACSAESFDLQIVASKCGGYDKIHKVLTTISITGAVCEDGRKVWADK